MKKKIAIISEGHYASTIPLAKHLADCGCLVDYFLLRDHRPNVIEGANINVQKFLFGTKKIKHDDARELYDYVGSNGMWIYMSAIISLFEHIPVLKVFVKGNYWERRLLKRLEKGNYDGINLVGRYNSIVIPRLIKKLPSDRMIVSLHEVCDHKNSNFSCISDFMSYLFKDNVKIVVHSRKTYDDILNYEGCKKDRISVIPFGVFESYSVIKDCENSIIPSDYILMVGLITSYKGIDVLYKALSKVPDLKGYKVVIAGDGWVPVIDKIKDDDRFVYIPGYLSNELFVSLIKNCRFIVCPYLSMSQSGIPQSAYLFDKPILASDLDGFHGIVVDKVTGLLSTAGNADELAENIKLMINDDSLIDRLSERIRIFKRTSPEYSWESIVRKYLLLWDGKSCLDC